MSRPDGIATTEHYTFAGSQAVDMPSKYLPELKRGAIDNAIAEVRNHKLFGLLTQPLHEELYRRQDFNFMDELSEGQQLFLAYDYLKTQVMQGGFLQFLVNGYVGLLPDMPAWLYTVDAKEMAKVIDDVLKVYVLNIGLLDKETTPEEFAKLYDELKEFEMLDERFNTIDEETMNALETYAKYHLDEFVTVVED